MTALECKKRAKSMWCECSEWNWLVDFRRKIENNWSFVLHEAPFFSVLAASSAARLLRSLILTISRHSQ